MPARDHLESLWGPDFIFTRCETAPVVRDDRLRSATRLLTSPFRHSPRSPRPLGRARSRRPYRRDFPHPPGCRPLRPVRDGRGCLLCARPQSRLPQGPAAMTVAPLETRRARYEAATPRVRLSGDACGHWTLAGSDSRAREFTDFETALDSARHVPGSETATIEIWQGGEYICCLQPEDRPYRGAAIHTARIASETRAFTATERYANRAAQVLMAIAGPLFWIALLVITLAASLGWRLTLL
jgi:hypothetical protein